MSIDYVCGIDLGTTNTVCSILKLNDNVAAADIELVQIKQFNRVKVNDALESLPSVVYVDPSKKEVFTGAYAKELFETGRYPQQTVASFKMCLNTNEKYHLTDDTSTIALSPQECSEFILRTVLNTLQNQYGQKPKHTVITIPAAFDSDERQKTREAALHAGFENITLLDEPTAAMLFFLNGAGQGKTANDLSQPKYYLVYDIGGGTLDICVAKLYQNENGEPQTEILGRSERADFGGDAFDIRLAAYLLNQFETAQVPLGKFEPKQQLQIINRLLGHASRGKKDISSALAKRYIKWVDESTDSRKRRLLRGLSSGINISGVLLDAYQHNGQIIPLTLMPTITTGNDLLLMFGHLLGLRCDVSDDAGTLLKEFVGNAKTQVSENLQELVAPLFDDTFEFSNNALVPLITTLNQAKQFAPDLEISDVLLTGGMSKFFAVDLLLRSHFQSHTNIKELDAMQSVSKGATYHAYKLHQPKQSKIFGLTITKDRLASPVCIKKGDDFDIIIPEETSPGESGVYDYIIQSDDPPTRLGIFLYSGDPSDPEGLEQLDGRYFSMTKAYQKGEIIQISWTLTQNKTVELNSVVGDLIVDTSKSSVNKQQSVVQQFTLTPEYYDAS